MKVFDIVTEARVPSIRAQIINDVARHGGRPEEYFVRFTDVDRLGFSDRQRFKKHVDVDHPRFSIASLGSAQGRRALWFYPLREYLSQSAQGQYAMDMPYVWLVKLRPDAWLQHVGHDSKLQVEQPPAGKQRVGIMKKGTLPQAVFFEPAFDIIGRYYDYAGQHKRHGEVRGRPEPTFFDRVRGQA